MQRIAIFGSTGSIGTQALEVVRTHRDRMRATVLAAGSSVEKLAEQAREFRPAAVVIGEPEREAKLKAELADLSSIEILSGPDGLVEAARRSDVDVVLAAMIGARGLPVSLAALEGGKRLALANKESMVAAGPLMNACAKGNGAEILPVDSEHSALHQALAGGRLDEVEKLILTASGGPFRTRPRDTWNEITIDEALKHPTWNMGPKITIDSATMMNKALEIVEARFLFDIPAERIQVVVHPQSMVHSMVLYRDGSVMAQLGLPDMRVPIQYALTYPARLPGPDPVFDPARYDGLRFSEPDLDRFPSLRFGFEAAEKGGVFGAVLNAANEQAVALFLDGKITFVEIFSRVEEVLSRCPEDGSVPDLGQVLEADRWAREETLRCS